MYLKNCIRLFAPILLMIVSCSKNDLTIEEKLKNLPEGYALLQVETVDIQFQQESVNGKKEASAKFATNNNSKSLPSNGNGFKCEVSLEPISNSPNFKNLNRIDKQGSLVTKTVEKGIRYRLYIFDKISGDIVDSASYVRGEEYKAEPIKILGNKEYTIIAYSDNSDEKFPAYLSNKANIKTAEILNGDVNFMFHTEDIMIATKSDNVIKIKFKHMFSEVTTTVKLDNATAGHSYIRNISEATFINPAYETTKFKVKDQTIEGITPKVSGAPVTFDFIPFTNTTTKSITSNAPTIVHSSGSPGQMTIEALTIGNVTRGGLVINDINLTPGVKYNLVLTFNVPETLEVLDNPYFQYYDGSGSNGTKTFEHEVTLNNPTFGAQMDIFYLDNSFQLYINDKPVFSKELDFEDILGSDVMFSDGTWYGSPGSGTSVIYYVNNAKPRKEIPIVRLVIDENGLISLYGRKNLDQTLRVLNFRGSINYTPVEFIKNGSNKIRFKSTNWNITDVWGRLYGIRLKNP